MLIVENERRTLYIHDLYMVLVGVFIGWLLSKVFLHILQKLPHSERTLKLLEKLRGGDDEYERNKFIAQVLLTCIEDDVSYGTRNEFIRSFLSKAFQVNLNKKSLKISPKLLRYVAYKFLKKENNVDVFELLGKIRKFNFYVDSIKKFRWEIIFGIPIGFAGGIVNLIPYIVFVIMFNLAILPTCVINCSDYVERLPSFQNNDDGRKQFYYFTLKNEGNIIVSPESEVDLYLPDLEANEKFNSNFVGEKPNSIDRKYTKFENLPKPKEVKFSDFKRLDPELIKVALELETTKDEPYIKRTLCPIQPSEVEDFL